MKSTKFLLVMAATTGLLLSSAVGSAGTVGAQEASPPAEVGRYSEYNAAATDRNSWSASIAGEIQFFSTSRSWKIFGDATVRQGSFNDDELYIRIKQNINNTTQDGRWYGLCESGGLDEGDVPCDRTLDLERTSGSGVNKTYYYWVGDNDSGEYFSFATRPGRGLRGIWVRVCHSVDGPDVCGTRVYAPNPYVPQ